MSQITEAGWRKVFEDIRALWVHNGNPIAPHALMTAGGHSDGFFNWNSVLARSSVADAAVAALYKKLEPANFKPQIVMGPQNGATFIAKRLALEHYRCAWSSPRKSEESESKKKQFVFDGTDTGAHPAGRLILSVEDTITTSQSILAAIKVCEDCGGLVLSEIGCIMNRSSLSHIGPRRIVALLTIPMNNWSAEECPLCKNVSKAVRPKDNWAELVACT